MIREKCIDRTENRREVSARKYTLSCKECDYTVIGKFNGHFWGIINVILWKPTAYGGTHTCLAYQEPLPIDKDMVRDFFEKNLQASANESMRHIVQYYWNKTDFDRKDYER